MAEFWLEASVDAITHEINFMDVGPGFVELDGNIPIILFHIPKQLGTRDPLDLSGEVVYGWSDDSADTSYTSLLAYVSETEDSLLYRWTIPYAFFKETRWAYFAVRFVQVNSRATITGTWTTKLKKVYVNPTLTGGKEAYEDQVTSVMAALNYRLQRLEAIFDGGYLIGWDATDDGEGNVALTYPADYYGKTDELTELTYKFEVLRRKVLGMSGVVREIMNPITNYKHARMDAPRVQDLHAIGFNYDVFFFRWYTSTTDADGNEVTSSTENAWQGESGTWFVGTKNTPYQYDVDNNLNGGFCAWQAGVGMIYKNGEKNATIFAMGVGGRYVYRCRRWAPATTGVPEWGDWFRAVDTDGGSTSVRIGSSTYSLSVDANGFVKATSSSSN